MARHCQVVQRVVLSLFLLTATAQAGHRAPFLVVLDPGHGGQDTGAIVQHDGREIREKDLTLRLAREIARALKAKGIRVAYTRKDDQFVTLDRRTQLANKAARGAQSTAFLSIHLNSNEDKRVSGAELYVLNATTNEASRRLADLENGISHSGRPGGRVAQLSENHETLDLILSDLATTANYGASVQLACSVQSAISQGVPGKRYAIRDRGVRQALFYVLMETHMPGVLLEAGFLSNELDLERLLSPLYRRHLAQSVASGLLKWRKKSSKSALSGVAKKAPPSCLVSKN